MLGKVASLARALGVILAVVAGFVTIPGLDVSLALVLLGLVSGLLYNDDNRMILMVTALALPLAAAALALIPMVGEQLGTVAIGIALSAAAAVATSVAIRLFGLIKSDLLGMTK